MPLLKCLSKSEVEYVLKEIHEGVCGGHSGGRMLAHKAIRAGYYWPTMNRESSELVKHCDKCQKIAKIDMSPLPELSSISSSWPFARRGVDIVGPMPRVRAIANFLLLPWITS